MGAPAPGGAIGDPRAPPGPPLLMRVAMNETLLRLVFVFSIKVHFSTETLVFCVFEVSLHTQRRTGGHLGSQKASGAGDGAGGAWCAHAHFARFLHTLSKLCDLDLYHQATHASMLQKQEPGGSTVLSGSKETCHDS